MAKACIFTIIKTIYICRIDAVLTKNALIYCTQSYDINNNGKKFDYWQ